MRPRIFAACLVVSSASPALADVATSLSKTALPEQSGAALYQHVCQGCHQPGGRGAVGAGAFPALASNQKLAVAGYPIGMVLNGNGGMPWFNGQLSDAQVADIVNYVRTHFGNAYTDTVTPADVAAARGPVPVLER